MILTYIAALPAHCGRSQAARRIFGNGWLRLLSRSGCCGSKTISVRRSWQSLSAAERWPMRSSSASAEIPPTGARSAMPDSGAGRAIPTISSNGSAGSPIPSSDSRSIILGGSRRCWNRSSCTGSWSASRAFPRWERRCCPTAARATATVSCAREPVLPASAEGWNRMGSIGSSEYPAPNILPACQLFTQSNGQGLVICRTWNRAH